MASFKEFIAKPINFNFFLLRKLPMAFIAGLKIQSLTDEQSRVSVPYKWLTTNPFKSIYFACLSMAAEMSSGILVMSHIQDSKASISMLVIEINGAFYKKANETIFFECNDGTKIKEAILLAKTSKEVVLIDTTSIGRNGKNEEICVFKINWSVKSK